MPEGNGEQHPGDPRRRLRRHRYQEGPGFLFLATQGGRPTSLEPENSVAEVRRRMRAVRLAAELGIEAGLATGVSRRSVFRWSALYKAGGIQAPIPGPRYERSQPNELWHIDIKGPFFIQLAGRGYLKTWLFGLVDDHSRFLIGLQINTDWQAAPVLRWVEECFELCGQPLQLMSDNGSPFVVWMPGVLTRFGKRLRDLKIHHLRTQISTPWTNGKIEAFWEVLQNEVLDRQWFRSLSQAEAELGRFADYYNFHRLSGTLGWCTPAERYLGTPFTDRGFEHIPALEHLQPWLDALMTAAA